MKNKVFISAFVLILALCAGCGGKTDKPVSEAGRSKPVTGIDACFDEELGYYNESPSVIRIGAKQYMFYTRNEQKDMQTDTIAVRSAEYRNGKWNYGEFRTVLRPTEKGWDGASVFAADVVKGEFNYNGKIYAYLMAYSGSSKQNRTNAQIGFAVCDTIDGDYIKVGENPIVEFSKQEQTAVGLTNYKGLTEPSLVSYDKKGKITLFYSHYGKFNNSYALEMDCSDLNSVIRGGRIKLNVSGLADGLNSPMLFSADYVYDPDENIYIVCRNYGGSVSGLPSVAEAVQTVEADADEIYKVYDNLPGTVPAEGVWKLYNSRQRRISAIHTGVDDADTSRGNGYKRIYNGCVVSDQYGHSVSSREIQIYFTSSAVSGDDGLEGNEYVFTPMIHEYTITRG